MDRDAGLGLPGTMSSVSTNFGLAICTVETARGHLMGGNFVYSSTTRLDVSLGV